MDMEPSNVQELEKIKEIDPDLSLTHENAPQPMKTEESKEKPNLTRVSALDMILKCLWGISVFKRNLVQFQETEHKITEEESIIQLHDFILKNLTLTNPMEPNNVSEMLLMIMELIPLNTHFELCEIAKKICNRCRMETIYPLQCSYGLNMIASSLREIKSAFLDFTFENIIKVIRINLMMPCDNEVCGKRSYVQHILHNLPSVFTIALEWENNESEEEILNTICVLETEIDISVIFQYEGDSEFTKYNLVSMVCLCGDQYNCVAYENKRWVRYFCTEKEVIGDWNSVISILPKLNIRPQILFFEKVMRRDQIVSEKRTEEH